MSRTFGRHPGIIADSPVFDAPYNALPGVAQDSVFVRTNFPAWAASVDLVATGTGVAIGTRIFLRKGDPIANVTFVAGNTALATGTAGWHALYTPAGVLMAQSAAQGAAAWAANTARKLALATVQVAPADGWYIVATSTTASTVQTLLGCAPLVTASSAMHTDSKPFGFTFGSATGDVAPATTGAQTAIAKCPFVLLN